MQLIFQTFWVWKGYLLCRSPLGFSEVFVIAASLLLIHAFVVLLLSPLLWRTESPNHTLITTWIQGSAQEFSQQWEKQVLELSPKVNEQQRWLHYYPRSGNSFQFRQSLKKISTDNYWLQMFKEAESVTASILDVGFHASISMMYWMFILWLFFLHNRYSGFINMLLLTGY